MWCLGEAQGCSGQPQLLARRRNVEGLRRRGRGVAKAPSQLQARTAPAHPEHARAPLPRRRPRRSAPLTPWC
eukprot:6223809-Prorocentrum_lima.AAC.1